MQFAIDPPAPRTVPGKVEFGKWHAIRIEARGSRFKVFLDGKQLFAFTRDGFERGGLGLQTYKTSARFRNLKVTAPDGAVLFEGLPRLHQPPEGGSWPALP